MRGTWAQQGFSLLEVLIAAAIMALGLAGLAALLMQSVAATSNGARQSAASVLADSLAQQMRLMPGHADLYLTAAPNAAVECLGPASCAPGQFAAHNLARWQAEISAALPGGNGIVCNDSTLDDGAPGAVSCDGAGTMAIKIFWPEPDGQDFRRHAIAVWL